MPYSPHSSPAEASIPIARGLAAAHPDALLPCPVCCASLKGNDLDKHLFKVHEVAVRNAAITLAGDCTWSGIDNRLFMYLAGGMGFTVVSLAVMLVWFRDPGSISGEGLVGLRSILVWTAGAGVAAVPATLCVHDRLRMVVRLEGNALKWRGRLGLSWHTVRLPTVLTVGVLQNWLLTVSATPTTEDPEYVEVSVSSYLSFGTRRAPFVVGCRQKCTFNTHWTRGVRVGRKRIGRHLMVNQETFAALQYQLAARGMLSLK